VAVREFGAVREQTDIAAFIDDRLTIMEQAGLNYAWWAWQLDSDSVYDAFDIMRGPDPDNHADVPNALQSAITARWAIAGPRPPS